MRAAQWLGVTLASGLASGLLSGIASAKAAPSPSSWASGVGAGLLAATLVAILWYSWETRRLVDGQEASAEVEKHPWLSATTLRQEALQEGAHPLLFGGFRLWLPITNVGRTPAYDVQVKTRWTSTSPKVVASPLERTIEDQVLVPHDTLHAWLGEVGFLVPHGEDADLRVSINYTVLNGGCGEVSLTFLYRNRAWMNGPTFYRFQLADGRTYGRSAMQGRA